MKIYAAVELVVVEASGPSLRSSASADSELGLFQLIPSVRRLGNTSELKMLAIATVEALNRDVRTGHPTDSEVAEAVKIDKKRMSDYTKEIDMAKGAFRQAVMKRLHPFLKVAVLMHSREGTALPTKPHVISSISGRK
jgi:hypothetical protein